MEDSSLCHPLHLRLTSACYPYYCHPCQGDRALAICSLIQAAPWQEKALEESEAQLAKDSAEKFDRLQRRSAHCGYQWDTLKRVKRFSHVLILREKWSGTGLITYDRLITNEGNAVFNESTGIWTAGFSGVYQVTWSAQSSPNDNQRNTVYLMRCQKFRGTFWSKITVVS